MDNTVNADYGEVRRDPPYSGSTDQDDSTRRRNISLGMNVACWAALIVTIACNVLFEVFRLGGVTVAEVSNQVFTWFSPSEYAFSIWGAIYVALVVWMFAETRRAMQVKSLDNRQIGLFVLSCALNVIWLIAFHFQQIAIAFVAIVALWADLALLYVSLRDDKSRTRMNLAPFSLYFGWITVAMIVNATNLATRMFAPSAFANQASTIVLVLAVLAVAVLSVRNSRDYVFPLVILWATIGIGVHLMATDMMIAAAVLVLSGIGAVGVYVPALMRANQSPRMRASES